MSPGENFLYQLYQSMPIRFAFEPGSLKGLNSISNTLLFNQGCQLTVFDNRIAESLFAVNKSLK